MYTAHAKARMQQQAWSSANLPFKGADRISAS